MMPHREHIEEDEDGLGRTVWTFTLDDGQVTLRGKHTQSRKSTRHSWVTDRCWPKRRHCAELEKPGEDEKRTEGMALMRDALVWGGRYR